MRVHTQNHRLQVYVRSLASAPHLLIPVGKPVRVRVRVSSGVPVGKPVPAVRVRVFWRVGYRYGSGYLRVTHALAYLGVVWRHLIGLVSPCFRFHSCQSALLPIGRWLVQAVCVVGMLRLGTIHCFLCSSILGLPSVLGVL